MGRTGRRRGRRRWGACCLFSTLVRGPRGGEGRRGQRDLRYGRWVGCGDSDPGGPKHRLSGCHHRGQVPAAAGGGTGQVRGGMGEPNGVKRVLG